MDPFQSASVIAAPNMLLTSMFSLCRCTRLSTQLIIATAVHSIENRLFTLLLAAVKYQGCQNHGERMKLFNLLSQEVNKWV